MVEKDRIPHVAIGRALVAVDAEILSLQRRAAGLETLDADGLESLVTEAAALESRRAALLRLNSTALRASAGR